MSFGERLGKLVLATGLGVSGGIYIWTPVIDSLREQVS